MGDGRLDDARPDNAGVDDAGERLAAEIATLRESSQRALATGSLARASHLSFSLGSRLVEVGDHSGAEAAYRHAVVLADLAGGDDPEVVLAAYRSLVRFLEPSEEAVELAEDLLWILKEVDPTRHVMRLAEAEECLAHALLRHAIVEPGTVDHALRVAALTIEDLEVTCSHGSVRSLQLLVADALRSAGREAAAAGWQADADKYGERCDVMVQEIPGHVHLWDVVVGGGAQ